MAQRRFEVRAALDGTAAVELRRITDAHIDLEDVLAWGERQSPPTTIVDALAQDEYSHDVIVPYGKLFLVYGTT